MQNKQTNEQTPQLTRYAFTAESISPELIKNSHFIIKQLCKQ